ncbi:MAG: winged helix-turn-helix domain-containing protein [Acidobacteriia bacterium]|nr:winged helix-turn-helix domain-containing protein [Terriglobia bacterium]
MSSIVRFGSYEVDLCAGQLRKCGVRINLRDQSFQVLAALLEHAGEVVTREQLQRRLWHGDVFVDFENNLNTAVARLRGALCDSSDHPRFIETLPRRGYRFMAQVSEAPALPQPVPASRARLVVLPFVNFSGDSAQDYFSDAMTDEIVTALASLAPEQLAVIARTTAMHYKGSHKDVSRIGRELDVDYVVEGALRHSEVQVAVNVQLIQTSDQAHLFARRYEADLRDIFHIQNSIAQDIAAHIPSMADKIRGEQVRRQPTENLAAYSEYIKGRYEMWKWRPESVTKAKKHFEAALKHDAEFALACDGLANLYWYLGFWGFAPPDETEPIRRFYALRAFELDPTLAEPQTLVAFHPEKCNYIGAYSYNWAETEKQMALARELDPNSPLIRVRHATVLLVLGRIDEAVAELERALEFDPLSPEVRFWLGELFFFGRKYERGLEQARQLVELEPEHQVAYMVLGQVYLGMQRFEESVAALRHAVEISGEFPLMLGWLGLALGLGGYTEEARTVLERLRVIASQRFVLPTSLAWIHFGLGEIDGAFEWMERAVDRNDGWIPALKSYPFLDPLRADPRFAALLRKMNLEA